MGSGDVHVFVEDGEDGTGLVEMLEWNGIRLDGKARIWITKYSRCIYRSKYVENGPF